VGVWLTGVARSDFHNLPLGSLETIHKVCLADSNRYVSLSCSFPLVSVIANLTLHSSRFRTLAPLQQPPHVIALASLYITSLLLFGPVEAEKIRAENQIGEIDLTHVDLLEETIKGRNAIEQDASWETDLRATLGDVDGEWTSQKQNSELAKAD